MRFDGFIIFCFEFVHRFEEAFTQFAAEDRTVGDMQQLSGFGHIHQCGQLIIAEGIQCGDLVDISGDMVKFEHIVEIVQRAFVHIAVERGIKFGYDGDCDQPAGTGGFEVEVVAGFASDGGIDGEFIAAAVDGTL